MFKEIYPSKMICPECHQDDATFRYDESGEPAMVCALCGHFGKVRAQRGPGNEVVLQPYASRWDGGSRHQAHGAAVFFARRGHVELHIPRAPFTRGRIEAFRSEMRSPDLDPQRCWLTRWTGVVVKFLYGDRSRLEAIGDGEEVHYVLVVE